VLFALEASRWSEDFAMLSSRSFALGGLSRLSQTVWQSTACSTVEVNRLFHTAQERNPSLSDNSQRQHQLTTIRHRSNRSRRGLYDGKDIRSGNNVSFSMKSTKRTFKPNVFKKRVYSEVLDEMVQFQITTSALRSIDKAGGLDNYLLNSRHVTEGEGYEAKKRILKVLKRKKRMEAKLAAVEEEEANVDDEEASEEEQDEGEGKR
jgi:large subunit ribosomal protein L28